MVNITFIVWVGDGVHVHPVYISHRLNGKYKKNEYEAKL